MGKIGEWEYVVVGWKEKMCCNKKATRAPPIMAVYLGIYCDKMHGDWRLAICGYLIFNLLRSKMSRARSE